MKKRVKRRLVKIFKQTGLVLCSFYIALSGTYVSPKELTNLYNLFRN